MNRPLIIILILLFLAFLFLGARYLSARFCGPAIAAAPIGAGNACGTWTFDDGEAFKAESNSYYRFRKNQANSVASKRSDFTETIEGTVNYLKGHKDRKLKITGLYENAESNAKINTNLGIARANDIKSKLSGMGVSADQLEVDSEILRENVVESDTLCKGAFFTFYSKGSNNANAKARTATSYIAGAATAVSAGKSLVGKSMIIYFATNKDELNLTARDKQDMKDIKAYMAQTPGARLEVSGHTDNRGDAKYNKRLSKGRAKFAAEQLTKRYGIPSKKMNSVGYGEERPIDNTNTASGLAKNRRVEIVLKEK